MKTLFLIRHAKSSWENPSLKDFDRPLNKRGLRDAPFMARMLEKKIPPPDKLVSSPAKRAYTTATYFAQAFGIDNEDIQQELGVYEAYTNELLFIIHRFDPKWDTVCLFGHNPGFTNLTNQYTDEIIPNVPTCGIVKISGKIDDWKDFQPDKMSLRAFYYPKQFQ